MFLGNNDVCAPSLEEITDPAVFEAQYRAGLDVLAASDATLVPLDMPCWRINNGAGHSGAAVIRYVQTDSNIRKSRLSGLEVMVRIWITWQVCCSCPLR